MNQSQKMVLDPTETIVGFNFNFMSALFAKAEELLKANWLYELHEGNPALCKPTALGSGILNHLSLQMGLCGDFMRHNLTNIEDVSNTLSAAEEFLTIFKNKNE